MPAPLVVHVGLDPDRAPALVGAPPEGARHLVGGPTERADVIVLHGRSGRCAPRLRRGRALVVHRPGSGDRPQRQRRALRWTDLVVVRAAAEVPAWAEAVGRPGRTVVVAPDDTAAAWDDVVAAALAPSGTVAERTMGEDLLVAPASPTGDVERLTGSGPAIWRELRAGRTPAEAAERLRPGDQRARATVEAFAAHLRQRGVQATA